MWKNIATAEPAKKPTKADLTSTAERNVETGMRYLWRASPDVLAAQHAEVN